MNYLSPCRFVLGFLFLFPFFLLAQPKDSLEYNILRETDPVKKTKGLINLYESNIDVDSAKANYFFNLACLVAQSEKLDEYILQLKLIEAKGQEKNFRFNKSLKKYLEALELAVKSNSEEDQAFILCKLSNIYRKVGNYNRAMELGIKSLNLNEGIKDSAGLQQSYLCLGNVYRYLNDYNRSLDYYTKSLEIAKNLNIKIEEAKTYNNFGIVYKELKQYDLAIQFYNKGFQIFTQLNDLSGIAGFYNNTGLIYLIEGELDKAYPNFQKALKIRKEIGDKRNETNAYINLGKYYTAKCDYSNAFNQYQMGLGIAKKYGFPDKREEIHLAISELYEKMGKFQSALEEYKRFDVLNDSLLSNTQVIEIARLEMTNSYEKEKIIKESLNKEYKLKHIIVYLVLSLLCLTALTFSLIVRLKLRKNQLYTKKLVDEKSKIETDLYEKNKEVVAYSLNLAQKNEFIKDISEELRKSHKTNGSIQIKELIKKIESESNVNVWDEFEIRFLQVYEGFYENLMKGIPSLSLNEKRLCAFLRLDMSTKEISLITGQSPHSINVARTRLRKKLGLVNNDQSISSFLSTI